MAGGNGGTRPGPLSGAHTRTADSDNSEQKCHLWHFPRLPGTPL
ncbi:hypothetical protein CUTA107171_11975 [Cupriavidus taiwanensis]